MPKIPKNKIIAMTNKASGIPFVRVLIVVVLIIIIVIALIRAGLIPGHLSFRLGGSLGGDVKPQVGKLAFPLSGGFSGSVGAGYEMTGEGFMNAMGQRENFEASAGPMSVVWYHRKNCPHCVAMKDEWAKFIEEMKKKHTNVKIMDYDGDTEEGR